MLFNAIGMDIFTLNAEISWKDIYIWEKKLGLTVIQVHANAGWSQSLSGETSIGTYTPRTIWVSGL